MAGVLTLSSAEFRRARKKLRDGLWAKVVLRGLRIAQLLRKYGTAAMAAPMATSGQAPETKYGKTMSAMPQTNGTTARCFFP